MTFKFNVTLKGIAKPPVWRRLMVPGDATFYRMHQIIQAAFGWKGHHMFQFTPKGYGSEPVIAVSGEDWMGEFLDCKKTRLDKIFTATGKSFTYLYDFGDNWFHTVTLEEILDQPVTHADCIEGRGACPPDDCGGPGGYHDLKRIMKFSGLPEHQEMREWLKLPKGVNWDADKFDVEKVREAVRKV